MPKQKKTKPNYFLPVLYVVVGVLAVLCLVLCLALAHKDKAQADKKLPSVSVGMMQYDTTSGRAVKRTDASVKDLRAFLESEATHSGCPDQAPGYEHVVAYTEDETQVFLKYGCGAADSPMYAVKTNGAWKALSPTNHFDGFGIPDCNYLTDNNISKEIAPVCVNGIGTGTPVYTAR